MRALSSFRFAFLVFTLASATVIACGSSDDTSGTRILTTPDGGNGGDGGGTSPEDASVTQPIQEADAGPLAPADGAVGSTDGGGASVSRLSTSGTQILDPAGHPLILRGWNWGQWGSVQPQDGADNRAQGANVVRIPLRWWGQYGDDTPDAAIADKVDSRIDAPPYIDQGHLDALDAMITNAAAAGLWIDLFVDSNCGQENNDSTIAYCGAGTDGGVGSFTNDPERLMQFAEVWKFLVARYQTQPFMGMYEILPEPSFGCTDQKNCADYGAAPAFYTPIAQAIRAIDPVTPILVGSNGGYSILHASSAYIDPTIVPGLIYTADVWLGDAENPSNLDYLTGFRNDAGVPIFVQQVGLHQSDPDAGTLTPAILSALDGDGIGWTWWTYRVTHTDTAVSFAPYYQGNDGGWQESASWLQLITAEFTP